MLQELVVAKWSGVRRGLLAVIDKFSDAELAFEPVKAGYSVGQYMLHVAHEEQIEVHWAIAGLLPEVPAAHDVGAYSDRAAIIAELERTHAATLAYLSSLSETDLTENVTLPWGETSRRIDLLWHVIEHEIHHRGELSLALGLLGKQGLDA